MPLLNKGLRQSVGALSLGFMMSAGVNLARANEPPAPPSGTTTMSAMLADIERQANEYIRTSTNTLKHRIAIIDPDQVNTYNGARASSPSYKLYYYLKDRGISLTAEDSSIVEWVMGGTYGPNSSNPQALHLSTDTNADTKPDLCLVIPEAADLSSRSLMEKWIGKAGPRYLQVEVDPGPYMMTARATWHEIWHCMDDEFVGAYNINSEKGFKFSHAIHRAEMFADVAATLSMASNGNLDILMQTADARAINSRWNGPKMMTDSSPQYDPAYYSGITYYITPAHDALQAHIRAVGIDRVKQYSLADIKRIATEITHQHALTVEQFRATAEYLKQGDTYLNAQKQSAEQGDAIAQGNVIFLNRYIARTDAARERIVTETARPVPPFVDVTPPLVREILRSISNEEKVEIHSAMESAVNAAKRDGLSARQGILNQIEAWRKQVHTSPVREEDLERKLYMAGLLLVNGYMDSLMAPAPVTGSPKP